MAFTKRSLLTYLGFVTWGDLAELTMYRDRYRRLVVYPKQYPKGTPSARTLEVRAAFKAAITKWHSLNHKKRQRWNLAARRASLCMSGYNLFLSYWITQDEPAVRTIERQTRLELID